MGESLRLAAESLCAFGGFGAAAISVVREDELVTIAVAGVDRVIDADGTPIAAPDLLGRSSPVDLCEDTLLPLADDWGLLKYIPHHRSNMPDLGWKVEGAYVGPQWHPSDLLLVPVRDATGRLRGLLSMDAPIDGLLPPPELRPVLERYAAQASQVLLTALEREEVAQRQRLAVAARRMLSRAADSDSPEATLGAVANDLIAAFELAGMRASVFEGGERRTLVEASAGLGHLDAVVNRLVRRSARCLWRDQLVGLVGRDQVLNFEGSADDLEHVLGLLRARRLESIVLVPLGAAAACLGAMAFYRHEGAPQWTDTECEAAQEIGRDLGRLLSIRRALRRERKAVEELRALDDYKSRLIATVAHEIKNPVAAIRGNLELAAEVAEVADVRPTLQAMGRGVDRIGRIVDDLLQLAAANDPDAQAARHPVDLTACVRTGVQLAVEPACGPASGVVTDLPDGPILVEADPHALEQAVVNLVGNALKYTPAGGAVSVSLHDLGDEAELVVADEGIGISAEDRERIFTEFFRSSDPAARSRPGTGLGLAIVDRIVAHHGGRIEVESELGRGSSFRVVLPTC